MKSDDNIDPKIEEKLEEEEIVKSTVRYVTRS
jgi:hypothetical protein